MNRTDQREYEALLAPLLSSVFGTALRLTRNRDDAEDLVQEAAVRAFKAFATFQKGTNFKAWFFRILTNLFYERHRRAQREPVRTDLEDAADLYLYGQSEALGLRARAEDPAELVMGKLTEEDIGRAIESLPDEYRLVATLYFMEEFAYEEIADIVHCPIGTVRSRLHRSRKMLQKALWSVAVEQGVVAELQPSGEGQQKGNA